MLAETDEPRTAPQQPPQAARPNALRLRSSDDLSELDKCAIGGAVVMPYS
jgi:hypothetical protein